LASYSRILVQWQKIYSNRKDTVQTKLWKTSMERQPYSTDRDFKSRRILCRNTKRLGTDNESNEGSLEEHKKVIWQEKAEFSITKG